MRGGAGAASGRDVRWRVRWRREDVPQMHPPTLWTPTAWRSGDGGPRTAEMRRDFGRERALKSKKRPSADWPQGAEHRAATDLWMLAWPFAAGGRHLRVEEEGEDGVGDEEALSSGAGVLRVATVC